MPGTMSSKPLILSISLAVIITSLLLIPNIYASFEDGRQKLTSVERSDLLDQPLESGRVSGSWSEMGSGSATGGGISQNSDESRYPSISAAANGIIYIVWDDKSGGGREIYARRWSGSGWQEVGGGSASGGGISNNGGESQVPQGAVAPNGDYYVTWYDNSSGDSEIYVKRWTGSSWQEAGSGSASGGGISKNSTQSEVPKIAIAPDGTPYICWLDETSSDWEIYVRRFRNGSWQEVGSGSATGGGISNNSGTSRSCNIAIDSQGTPYVAWRDDSGGNFEVYVRRWDGNAWSEIGSSSARGGGISKTAEFSGSPYIRIDNNDRPGVTWNDSTVKPNEIYYRKWNGSSWVEVGSSASGGGISKNGGDSKATVLAYSGASPYIAWHDDTSGDAEIYVRRWTGSSWAELGSGSATGGGISKNSRESVKPSSVFGPDGTYYIAWSDDSSGDLEIYVKRWIDSSNQIPLAPTGISASDGTYDDKVRISWNASTNATTYQVFRATSASGNKTFVGETGGTIYDDTPASSGTTYYYWVTACNSNGCSYFSSYDTGWRGGQPPSAPDNVQASDGAYTDRVRVTWDTTSNTDDYEVYRATSSGGTRVLIGTRSSPLYDDSSAAISTTYYYWVKACNSFGCSDFSAYNSGWRAGSSTYTLSVQTSGQGTVNVNPDKPSYSSGETVTLTANANSGWRFAGWSGDLSGSNNPTTLTMNGDKLITALFESYDSFAYAAFFPAASAGFYNFSIYEGNIETEPNNEWRQANGALVSGRVYRGSLDSEDIDDYFLFVVPQKRLVEVTLWDIPKDQDYDLILRNQKRESLAFPNLPGQESEIISMDLPVGFYYVQVNNYEKETHSDQYSLKVVFE